MVDLIVEKAQVAIYDPKVQKESINMELNNNLQNFGEFQTTIFKIVNWRMGLLRGN